jgi:hypothetical protein
VCAMAGRYIRMSCLGSSGEVVRLDVELIEVAVALELTTSNRQWGGSIPGHRCRSCHVSIAICGSDSL